MAVRRARSSPFRHGLVGGGPIRLRAEDVSPAGGHLGDGEVGQGEAAAGELEVLGCGPGHAQELVEGHLVLEALVGGAQRVVDPGGVGAGPGDEAQHAERAERECAVLEGVGQGGEVGELALEREQLVHVAV
jgi:hypothetical protein